jgi:excisionase family DNA binding protein
MLTVNQVAKELNVSTKTIYRRIESGEMKAQYVAANCIRIDEADYAEYKAGLKERKTYTRRP